MSTEVSRARCSPSKHHLASPGRSVDHDRALRLANHAYEVASAQTAGPPAPVESFVRGTKRNRDAAELDEASNDDTHTSEASDGAGGTGKAWKNLICLCPPDQRVPRPRNAFILYRSHHQANLVAQHPRLSNPEISKLLGEQWKNAPPEVKAEWKEHAETEKRRHKHQHPDYKYNPRRRWSKQARDPTEPDNFAGTLCQKCGGRSMTSQPASSMGNTHDLSRSSPQPSPGIPTGGGRLPSLNGNYQAFSERRQSTHPSRPSSIAIPPLNDPNRAIDSKSPDAKRRRYTNEHIRHTQASRSATAGAYVLPTPFRNSFAGRYGPEQTKQWTPLSAGTAGVSSKQSRQATGPALPPLQSLEQPPSVEQYIVHMPFLVKIYQLGRISPPYRAPHGRPAIMRGVVIAVEGDDQTAVAEVIKWLETYLARDGQHHVKTAQGPTGPRAEEATTTIDEYLKVITEWQAKSKEMAAFITKAATAKGERSDGDEEIPPDAPSPAVLRPVILLQRYQLFASNAYSVRIPIMDSYKPLEHWQWMASLWRGIIGPDITVCIKDIRPEDMTKDSKLVEVQEELRAVIVKREARAGPESPHAKLDDSTLRRLGFEVGELMQNVG